MSYATIELGRVKIIDQKEEPTYTEAALKNPRKEGLP
jgi:hypothetical protein